MDHVLIYRVAIFGLGIATSILLFSLLVWLNKRAISKGTHPLIRRFLAQAIIQAYKLSDAVFDATDKRLHSIQKREIAAMVYELLPDTISILWQDVNWKSMVSVMQFSDYVAAAYDDFVSGFQVLRHKVLNEMIKEIGETT